MAHQANGLTGIGQWGGTMLYGYRTVDNAAAVEADAYFDNAVGGGLNAGDVIIASLDTDGTPLTKLYHVVAGGADVSLRGLGAAITALTYNLVAGTANNALAAIPLPTDTPASADALRDDIAANIIPVIRDNMADLAAKIEEIRAAITV